MPNQCLLDSRKKNLPFRLFNVSCLLSSAMHWLAFCVPTGALCLCMCQCVIGGWGSLLLNSTLVCWAFSFRRLLVLTWWHRFLELTSNMVLCWAPSHLSGYSMCQPAPPLLASPAVYSITGSFLGSFTQCQIYTHPEKRMSLLSSVITLSVVILGTEDVCGVAVGCRLNRFTWR